MTVEVRVGQEKSQTHRLGKWGVENVESFVIHQQTLGGKYLHMLCIELELQFWFFFFFFFLYRFSFC